MTEHGSSSSPTGPGSDADDPLARAAAAGPLPGADIAAVLGAYDFHCFGTIADIGGGRGHLLRAVLEAVPTAEGVLFDLPEVITIVDIGTERLTAQAGDFFVDPLPAADAYILMEVLHDWPDADAAAILRAIRRSAPANATLLIIEGVID